VSTNGHRARLARDGIFNVRDLGGVPLADGRVVVPGRVWRADSLHRARDSVAVLVDHGVVRVLDLRDERERDDDGVLVAEGIEVQHHPVIDPTFEWPADDHDAPETLLVRRYCEILTSFGARFATALSSIAEVTTDPNRVDGAVAYHCAVGKDRTGLLTALLLGAIGADEEAIVEDYARSAASTAVQVSWLWSFGHPDGDASDEDLAVGLWSARPETMRATLGWIEERFGGVGGYLRQSGVDDDVPGALHAALTTDPAIQERPC
jgi:protein-tyrosine phosphatase